MKRYIYIYTQVILLLVLIFLTFFSTDLFNNHSIQFIEIADANKSWLWDVCLFIFSCSSIFWLYMNQDFKILELSEKLVVVSLLLWFSNTYFQESINNQMFALFALFAIINYVRIKKFQLHIIFYFFTVYFLWHCISLMWTCNYENGIHIISRYSMFVLAPLFFACANLDVKKINMVSYAFYMFSKIYLLIALCYAVCSLGAMNIDFSEFINFRKSVVGSVPMYKYITGWSNFRHPSFISFCHVFGLVIGFYLVKLKQIKWHDLLLYSLLSLFLIVLQQSRVGLILWTLAIVLGFEYILWSRKKAVFAYSVFIMLAGVLFIFLFKQRICDFVYDPQREALFKASIWNISQNPILGTGIGGLEQALNSKDTVNNLGFELSKPYKHPHNQILCDLMQTGIIGVFIYLLMIVCLLISAIRYRNFILFVFLALAITMSLIEEITFNSKPQMIFLLFTNMALYYSYPHGFSIKRTL